MTTQHLPAVSREANQRFADWLEKLSYDSSHIQVEIPEWIQSTSDRNVFKNFIYPQHKLESGDSTIFNDRIILSTQNASVTRLNSEIAKVQTVESREYFSFDMVHNDPSGQFGHYPEYLRKMEIDDLPDGILKLHVGMPIMLLRDYYPKIGLCNGTRLIITQLFSLAVKARIISQNPRFNGEEHIIPRVTQTTSNGLPFTLTRKQLALRPCYSMPINKSQGQTFNYVGVDLTHPVSAHGQFYLAMSRVTDVSRLIVLLPPGTKQTKNIVYPEVLLRPPTI